MENFYTVYLKTVDNVTFYFVKKYQIFTEYKNVPPILDKYAMHTNFKEACKIAMIYDETIQQQLIEKLHNSGALTKVINTQPLQAEIYRLRKRQISFPFKLRLMRMGKVS